ncbi:3-oxoacyl-[acyl-carrier-protein] synthase II [Thermosporothrix hazakensis]|jgi:3-oxoacyl-(acyl-carrier-protein) synthase|uniref:3-oxoacyl-[acyl-carrier-protein] synthase II n=1 Tax=Thermosporothrix hazakensis TaxID=644383 RepID=A0A326TRU4_THEHA|nr:beta-ketoacyl-[acyl-carrier-protein] synthase family protein [Thermosporothrix hazakensis]PZW18312.1 3-oxoacyl-[acyl-carrier-protein] synthase II [Thermosporothrix hazakensis]GCE51438.1 3-oxoacyl-[acyl-carrier-protein] synthase 2 [Thermosporothrix hazakensis]
MTAQIVVTGMGVVSPYGVGPDVLWDSVQAGKSGLTALTSFETAHIQCRAGGQLIDFDPERYYSRRQLRKMDRFSVFALIAVQQALTQAGLLLENNRPVWGQDEARSHRVGITVGNNLGGWEFAERELQNLWEHGPQAVSPYMAIAWFPAAVQGNISIQYGIKGVGRTFLSDRASGGHALVHALHCLLQHKVDIMIAGGTEAPFSPYAALCYETSGLMSRQASQNPYTAYRPFDRQHDGLVPAEGAAFFVLERAEDAHHRGATILGELAGWATTHDGYDFIQPAPDGRVYAETMLAALQRAGLQPGDIDCTFAAGSAVPAEDVSETRAIHQAFGKHAHRIPVSTPKSAFGNLFGAALPVDLALALLALRHQTIPPTLHLDQAAPECDLDYVPRVPRAASNLSACLLNARGMGGTNVSLVLKRYEKPL